MSQLEEAKTANTVNTEKNLKITTLCKDCYFATWDKSGLFQKGCSLKKLDAFDFNGRVSNEVDEETTQHYYSIDTICQFKRDEVWAKQYESPVVQINRETELAVTYVCLAGNAKQAARYIKKINTLKSTKMPKKIIVVMTNSPQAGRDSEAAQILSIKSNNIPLNVLYSLDDSKSGIEHVDAAFQKIDTTYYTVWENEKEIKSNFVNRLDQAVNHLMKRAVLFDSGSNNGSTFHVNVHRMLGGNKDLPLREKILSAVVDQNNKEGIFKFEGKTNKTSKSSKKVKVSNEQK